MREIKFRAWYKISKEMVKVGQITLEKGTWNYEPENREYIGVCVPYQPSFVLMQSTGLFDKNGVEIYEGDIVYSEDEDANAEIKWDEDSARFIIEFDDLVVDFDNYYGHDLEVIGNIYENPEMLEKGVRV